jgi:hypothetical protein
MKEKLPLCDLLDKIRDVVNEPRIMKKLRAQGHVWNIITSAMDAIVDTDLAIEAYLNAINEPASSGEYHLKKGMDYLFCSGALQALFVQQDAALLIAKRLDIDFDLTKFPKLREIRDIRNASIGHPVDQEHKYSNFIVQHSLGPSGFSLLTFQDGEGDYLVKNISVPDIIATQREGLSNVLQNIIDHLHEREGFHREKYRMVKLSEIIGSTLLYFCEKLSEGIQNHGAAGIGLAALQTLADNLKSAESAMKERGIERDTYDSVGYCYEILEFPMNELRQYYEQKKNGQATIIDDRTAYVFSFFISKHMQKLKEVLAEVDAEYTEDPSSD